MGDVDCAAEMLRMLIVKYDDEVKDAEFSKKNTIIISRTRNRLQFCKRS